jgi:FKBP-type peptidyl-prolyl cis-trans isomerase 2
LIQGKRWINLLPETPWFYNRGGADHPRLESKMMGMAVGEKAKISVEPQNAYGLINPELYQEIRRDQFPADIEIKPGMTFQSHGPQWANDYKG